MQEVDPPVRDKTLRGLIKGWRKYLLKEECRANKQRLATRNRIAGWS
jgi:hypothetical protein